MGDITLLPSQFLSRKTTLALTDLGETHFHSLTTSSLISLFGIFINYLYLAHFLNGSGKINNVENVKSFSHIFYLIK